MVRLTLEELGIDYEDRRIRTADEWSELKSRMPFRQLPLYEENDFILAQSHAIIRHLAREHDLYGRDEKDRARCDMVEECLYDAQETLWRHFWDPEFERKRQSFAEESICPVLEDLARLLSDNPAHFVGSRLTYVDLYAFVYLDQLRAFFPETLGLVKSVKEFRDRIADRPRVRNYLSSNRRPSGIGIGIRGLIVDPEASGPRAKTPWDHQFPA
jgi:glutathione S-transferase